MEKLDIIKQNMFNDIKQYHIKNNKELNSSILIKYGFTPLEIELLINKNLLNINYKKTQTEDNKMIKQNLIEKNININLVTEYKKYIIKNNISRKHIDTLYKIIEQYCLKNKTISYTTIREKILKKYKLYIDVNSFNGGQNRARYYFPLYRHPLTVLMLQNKVKQVKKNIYKLNK